MALLVAAPGSAGAATCDWIDSIQSWNGSFGWSWSHHDSWVQLPDLSLAVATGDAGSGQFELEGFIGTFDGDIDGALAFDDDYRAEDLEGVVTYEHTVLSGPIEGPFPGMAARMMLQLDDLSCTYSWSAGVWGSGTVTTEAGSEAITTQPNMIWSGVHPIPEIPGPLSFSGPVRVTINPTIPSPEPQFVPYGATPSLNRVNAPAPLPAQVD